MPSAHNTDPFCFALAGVLREERVKSGLSVKSLSKKAGVSRQVIGNFEHGLQIPILSNAAKIAAGLGLKFSEISIRAEDQLAKAAAPPAKRAWKRAK